MMMVRVEYPDGTQQLVHPYVLNQLIAARAITRFQRADGWALLDGTSHVRRRAKDIYLCENPRRPSA